jgi:hypothetical protein
MTFDHRQAVEFARGGAIGERTEMAPVNLALDAWGGFEADERARLGGGWAYAGEVRPHQGDATRAALRGQALPQHDSRGGRCIT